MLIWLYLISDAGNVLIRIDPWDAENATDRVMSASKIAFSRFHKAIFVHGKFFYWIMIFFWF